MAILSALQSRRLLLCLGPGGVGKTTCAAALGLAAAQSGRKTLVLTIDPARRLAAAIGLESLDHVARAIEPEHFRRAGIDPCPVAFMVLDVQRTFDDLIERLAPDSKTAARLRQNRIYREIVAHLPGAHEYAAMEAVCRLRDLADYDLLVLDTPPSRNALDFLEAPRRVAQAIDNPVLEWIVRASAVGTRGLGLAGSFVIAKLRRFVGATLLAELGVFLGEFHGLLLGFRERARIVGRLLQDPELGFVLVSTPTPDAVEETFFLESRLHEWNQSAAAWIANRVCLPSKQPLPTHLHELIANAATDLSPEDREKAIAALRALWSQLDSLAVDDAVGTQKLRSRMGAAPLACIPLLAQDVHDLAGLAKMAKYLAADA